MIHLDPKAIVEQFMSFSERIDRHQLAGGWAGLPVSDLARIHNGFATASGGAS